MLIIETQANRTRALQYNKPIECSWDPLLVLQNQLPEESEGYCQWKTSDILTSYLLEKSTQTINCTYYLSKRAEELLVWLYKRVPNSSEVVTNAPFTAIIDIFLESYYEEWFSQFSGSPNDKAFLRDIQRLVSNVFAWQSGAKQGGTEITYDVGNVYSQSVKSICKLGVIKGGEVIYGHKVLKVVGGWANFICEPPARIFSLLSQLKQKENATDVSYFQYAEEYLTPYLLLQAFIEALAKNYASSVTNNFIKFYGIADIMTNSLNQAQAKVMSQLTGLYFDFNAGETITGKLKVMEHIRDGEISMLDKAQLYLTEVIVNSLSAAGFTYILATPAKIAQDGAGIILGILTKATEAVKIGEEVYEAYMKIIKEFLSNEEPFAIDKSLEKSNDTCPAPKFYGYEETDSNNQTFIYPDLLPSENIYEMSLSYSELEGYYINQFMI